MILYADGRVVRGWRELFAPFPNGEAWARHNIAQRVECWWRNTVRLRRFVSPF